MSNNETCQFTYGSLRIGIIAVVFSSVSFCINCFALLILAKSKKLVAQIKTFTCHIALSDALLGIVILLPGIINCFCVHISVIWIITITRTITTASYLFTTTLAIERLVSVAFPNAYIIHITDEKVKNVCYSIWIFTVCYLVLAVASLYQEHYHVILEDVSDVFSSIVYLIMAISLTSSSILLYRYGQSQIKKMAFNFHPRKRKFFQQHYGKTITILIVCSLMVFCTFPGFILTMIKIADEDVYIQTEPLLKYPIKILAFMQHMLNPFLYIFRFEACRDIVKLYIPCISRKSDKPVTTLIDE